MSDLKKKLDKGIAYLKRNGVRQTIKRAGRKAALSGKVDYEKWLKQHLADEQELRHQTEEQLWKRTEVTALLFPGSYEEEQRTRKSLSNQTFGPIKTETPDTWNSENEPENHMLLLICAGAVLRPEAVYKMVKMAAGKQESVLLYTDHDVCDETGRSHAPFCKPEYDRILQEQINYLGAVLLVSRELEKAVNRNDMAQTWQQLTRSAGNILHLPGMLCQITEKMEKDLERPGWKQARPLTEEALVSVIIPNRDHREDLVCCVDSLLELGGYENLEILIVENNSEEPETFQEYERLMKKDARIHLITWKEKFNYSAINNAAAGQAHGRYLLFLNNDTKVKKGGSIRELIRCCQTEEAGAAGCLLVYADGTVQHGGVVLGYGGIAGHAFEGMSLEEYQTYRYSKVVRQMSAVTAACMLVETDAFWKIGGFTEELGVAYNDIDLCMKLQKAGYMVLYDPKAELYHYESQTRGFEMTSEKAARVKREAEYFCERWEKELKQGDPFYSPLLTLEKADFSLKR